MISPLRPAIRTPPAAAEPLPKAPELLDCLIQTRQMSHHPSIDATFANVHSLDRTTGETIPLEYHVTGKQTLERKGSHLVVRDVAFLPVHMGTYDFTYRFEPGLGNTLRMLRGLIPRIRAAYPDAKTMTVKAERQTDDYQGPKARVREIDLTQYPILDEWSDDLFEPGA